MKAVDLRRGELKKFLRARRAQLKPDEAGLKPTPRRRTPGLRREEVAQLAGVSVTWYTWLEQGRDIRCSTDLAERLSRALKLSKSDRTYLFRLAGLADPIPSERSAFVDDLTALLEAFRGPAFLLNPRLDVVTYNAIADWVFEFSALDKKFANNHVWRGFMDPRRRALYVDWEELMVKAVGALRSNFANRVDDPEFQDLIDALRADRDFQRMWEAHQTLPLDPIEVRLQRPDIGRMQFVSHRLVTPGAVDHIVFFLLPLDTITGDALFVANSR